jgi:hypothetical protein
MALGEYPDVPTVHAENSLRFHNSRNLRRIPRGMTKEYRRLVLEIIRLMLLDVDGHLALTSLKSRCCFRWQILLRRHNGSVDLLAQQGVE